MAKSERFKKLEYSDSDLLNVAVRQSFQDDKEEAADHGLLFDIEISKYKKIVLSNCYFCQSPAATPITTRHKKSGLDRKKLNAPHSKSNTIACCSFCYKARRKIHPKMVFRILLIHARLGTLDEKS